MICLIVEGVLSATRITRALVLVVLKWLVA